MSRSSSKPPLHVQLDTKGTVSLSVSLTQCKQITHGLMVRAKHRIQCIQKARIIQGAYLSNHIHGIPHQTTVTGCQLTWENAPSHDGTRSRFNSSVPITAVCIHEQGQLLSRAGNQRSKHVSCPLAEKRASLTVTKDL